jgi:hypothetical protein
MAPEDVRNKRVVTFVTCTEFELLQNLAQARKSSLSSFCHEIISSHLKDKVAESSD